MARAANYKRDVALDAALGLFWRKGFHATTLKDLEEILSMKPGSIYAAFKSKENLYLLTLQRYFNRSLEKFREHMANARSPLSGLTEHILAFARLSPDDQACQACMLTKTLIDTKSTNPEISEITNTYLEQMCAEFEKAFVAARDANELPESSDPNRLARRYLANVSALRFELHRGASAKAIAELAEDMALEVNHPRH